METRTQLATEMTQLAGVTLPQETEDVALEQSNLTLGAKPKQVKKGHPA